MLKKGQSTWWMKRTSKADIIIAIIMIIMMVVSVYPFWYTIIVSFSDRAKVAAGYVIFAPLGFNINAYQLLLKDKGFFSSFFVSVFRVILGCAINMSVTLLAAYPLSKRDDEFKFRRAFAWFFMLNMLFTGGLIPWYLNVRNLKLIDTIWALVLPGAVPIFNVILMMSFFRSLPGSLSEAARVDGANPLLILASIYIPISLPAIATITLFCVVNHWNSYFDGLILINTPEKQPLQTFIYQLSLNVSSKTMSTEELRQYMKVSNETLNAAKIGIAMVPILAVYPFLQRYFIVGITLGSIKE